MEDRRLGPESTLDRARGCRCESDLRHQHETTSAARQHLFQAPQIDLGLARPGDAFEEEGRVLIIDEGSTNRLDYLSLLIGQDMPAAGGFEGPPLAARRWLLEAQQQARGVHSPQC